MAKDWSQALVNMRYEGDKWADKLVAEVVAEGSDELTGEQKMVELIRQIVKVHETVPDNMRDDMKAYFLNEDRPAWVDSEKIALGADLCIRHGVELCMILMCASLPACYADAPGVVALDQSHQLTKHPRRRVIETTRFALDVLQPGNLTDNNHGAITAKKVRLLHATNRRILHHQPEGRWNEKEWGIPLNQEDLALTLMTFATVVLDGMAKSHLYVSPEEQDAFMHTWRYVGYLMGVDETLLPENVEDGKSLYETIAKRVYASSPSGIALTEGLVNLLEEILPGEIMDGVIPAQIRLYMGEEVADMLGVAKVPPHGIMKRLMNVVGTVHGIEANLFRNHQLMGIASDSLGRLILKGLANLERADHRDQFHVPDMMSEIWNLDTKTPAESASPAVLAVVTESAKFETTSRPLPVEAMIASSQPISSSAPSHGTARGAASATAVAAPPSPLPAVAVVAERPNMETSSAPPPATAQTAAASAKPAKPETTWQRIQRMFRGN